MSRMRKVKKSKAPNSCYTCASLGWQRYMTGPYSGGVEYWCKDNGKDIECPKDFICNDWEKKRKTAKRD